MRITDVQVHLVEAPIPIERQVESGAGRKLSRQAALVEVLSDEELSGIGPCSFGSISFDLSIVDSLARNVFLPLLVGRDPRAIGSIWHDLYYGVLVRSLGNRGVGVAVLSAIEIALWDLKGRSLGQPLYSLLGGPMAPRVPVYGSSVYWDDINGSVRQARQFLQQGYQSVKIKVGADVEADIQRVEAVASAVGSSASILADGNLSYSRRDALRLGRALEGVGAVFFEEPIPLDDVEGYGWLAQRLDVPIAVGENLYTRWGFVPYLDAGVGVLQPDCSRVGGIAEARRVAELAEVRHRWIAPHTFSDAFTLCVNLHLALSTASTLILEEDATYNPLMTELIETPLPKEDGYLLPPTGPGLGIALNRPWAEAHRYRGEHAVTLGSVPTIGGAPEHHQ